MSKQRVDDKKLLNAIIHIEKQAIGAMICQVEYANTKTAHMKI